MPDVYFNEFSNALAKVNLGDACDAFVRALHHYPDRAYRYFIARASGQVQNAATVAGRSREVARDLERLFAANPHMNLLCDDAPDMVRRFVELRESNIAKGLKSVMMITQGKAASVSVSAIFNHGFSLPSYAYSFVSSHVIESWARDYSRGGACYTTHLMPTAENVRRIKRSGVEKIIVHVRDPRQSLLSMIHHVSLYPDQLAALAGSGFKELAIDEQIDELMGFYLSRIDWIRGWMDAAGELDIHFSSFEEFILDRDGFIERYLGYYGCPREYFDDHSVQTKKQGLDYHFRKGEIDEWRGVFSEKDARRLGIYMPAAMRQQFNWAD